MLKGIYKAASGMIPRIKKQEITANNIANASTAGYKKDSVFLKELNAARQVQLPRRSDWEQPMIDQIYIDYSQGTFEQTGNTLDVAISGNGFFILENPESGEQVFTRNGNFTADLEGFLVNSEGLRVMGDGGPIAVGAGAVNISDAGEVLIDDVEVGQLQVVDFPDKSELDRRDASSFTAPEGVASLPAEGYTVRQGFLERANINVIKEMVGMIITMRSYEAAAKAIQSQEDSLNALFNHVGRTNL